MSAQEGAPRAKRDPRDNLNKGKKCPECGKWHGNKTGGREGGTVCNGTRTFTRADGTTYTQKCTYLFTSSSVAKRRKLEEAHCPHNAEACMKLSKAKNAFEKIKEKVIKENTKSGGYAYVAYLANVEIDRLTKSAAAKGASSQEEMQVTLQEEIVPKTGEEASACSALFQYSTPGLDETGPLEKIFQNDIIRVAIQSEFHAIVSENLKGKIAKAVEQHNQQLQDSGAAEIGGAAAGDPPVPAEAAPHRFPDLMRFLTQIGKESCYDKLCEQNLDLVTLQMSVDDPKHPMTPALLKDEVGIALGDAYTIIRSVPGFVDPGTHGIQADPIVGALGN